MSSAKARSGRDIVDFSYSLPSDLEKAVAQARERWDQANSTARLWKKDPTLWTNDDEGKWLGWLDIVDEESANVSKFQALAAEIAEDGFTHLVLLGMGGSSCAPKCSVSPSASRPNAPNCWCSIPPTRCKFRVCAPRSIRAALYSACRANRALRSSRTSTCSISSRRPAKSWVKLRGNHFIAVTDPGSKLEAVAAQLGFRRVYHGVPSIGGRYSALSDFGLVPHAGMGLDTKKLLERTALMVEASKVSDATKNPGVTLGLILGTAATKFGRDKVTLHCTKSLADLGAWLEQLLAESTGKQGHGLIPVDREPLCPVGEYSNDRVFAYIKFAGDSGEEIESDYRCSRKSGSTRSSDCAKGSAMT